MTAHDIRLEMMARGDARYIGRMQAALRAEEANGDIFILYMDDEIARIVNRNPVWVRVLSDAEEEVANDR